MSVSDLIKLLADFPSEAEILVDDDGMPRPATDVRMVEYRPAARPNHQDAVLIV